MMITAGIGLIFNVVMGKMLHHHGPGDHHHGHDHGHTHGHDHAHDHDHKHHHDHSPNHENKSHDEDHKHDEEHQDNSHSHGSNTSSEEKNLGDALKENEADLSKIMENVNLRAATIHIIGDLI